MVSAQFDPDLNPYVRRIQDQAKVVQDQRTLWEFYEGKRAIVDLGCGNGHFLQEYSALHSSIYSLGVERRFKRIFKSAQKLQELNAQVIQMDIGDFLRSSPEAFWDEVWIQFPDPWPKDRHLKNRFITHQNLLRIQQILKPKGRFCFRSDHEPYWTLLQGWNNEASLFSNAKALSGDLFNDYPQTLYQRKFIELQVPLFSIEFVK